VDELDEEHAAGNRRSLLMARSTLRAQLEVASGADVNAQNAYAVVSQLAIELLRDGRDAPLP
jgi:urease gamma subunit